MKKVLIGVKVPEAMAVAFEEACKKQGFATKSDAMREMIEKFIAKKEPKPQPQPTPEPLAASMFTDIGPRRPDPGPNAFEDAILNWQIEWAGGDVKECKGLKAEYQKTKKTGEFFIDWLLRMGTTQ